MEALVTKDKETEKHVVFTTPTIWYCGPEGNFLLSEKGRRSGSALMALTPPEMELVKRIPGVLPVGALSRLLEAELVRERRAPRRLPGRFRKAALRLQKQYQAAWEPEMETTHFHSVGLKEAWDNFDSGETTCSHLLRFPSSMLAGKTYGQALGARFREWLRPGARILEVGGGTGVLASHLLDELADLKLDYTILDLSPRLQLSQKRECERHANVRFLLGDATDYDFEGARFDLVFSNEVIADFAVEVATRRNLETGNPANGAEVTALKYGLSLAGALPKFCINAGAISLVERLPKLLNPGGRVFLTEYGELDQFPAAVDLEGHREHSIHFGHLMQVASQLGYESELVSVGEFLRADGCVEVLNFSKAWLLSKALAPYLGLEIPLAYVPREQLPQVWGERLKFIGNLSFQSLEEAYLSPFRFKALILR